MSAGMLVGSFTSCCIFRGACSHSGLCVASVRVRLRCARVWACDMCVGRSPASVALTLSIDGGGTPCIRTQGVVGDIAELQDGELGVAAPQQHVRTCSLAGRAAHLLLIALSALVLPLTDMALWLVLHGVVLQPRAWDEFVASANPNERIAVWNELLRRAELAERADDDNSDDFMGAEALEAPLRVKFRTFGDACLPASAWAAYAGRAVAVAGWTRPAPAGAVGGGDGDGDAAAGAGDVDVGKVRMAVVQAPFLLAFNNKDGSGSGTAVTLRLSQREMDPRFNSRALRAVPTGGASGWPKTATKLQNRSV